MQIHPIRNRQDHEKALARIETLMDANLTPSQADEFDALVTLVDAYEEKNFPINAPTPIAVIEFYLDQNGLTRKDLEPLIGSRARVSEVMTGKRPLTIPMIQRLRDKFGISADILIASPSKPKKNSSRSSPQEKKKLSLQHDRRNAYGENAKSSRKNIPRSRQRSHQSLRRAANAPLQRLPGLVPEELAIDMELKSRTSVIEKSRKSFRKQADQPLGKMLEKKRGKKHTSNKAA
jgi:HTH-type transcriptional regulator / antitoxin HigA